MFNDLKKIKARVPLVTKDDWMDYDEGGRDSKQRSLSGSRDKTFIWCKSELFQELTDELRNNPECAYVARHNNDIKKGIDIRYFSVIEKDAFGACIGEVLTGRILNYFGIRTPYEIVVNKGAKLKLLSVDFEQEGYKFGPLVDLGMGIRQDALQTVSNLKNKLNNMHASPKSSISKLDDETFMQYREQFIEDVLYSLIVRLLILGDMDCHEFNLGIEIGENGQFYLINFDYEESFSHALDHVIIDFDSLIAVVSSCYPNVLNKFMNKFNKFIERTPTGRKKVYEEIIDNCPCFEGIDLSEYKYAIRMNIDEFVADREMGD